MTWGRSYIHLPCPGFYLHLRFGNCVCIDIIFELNMHIHHQVWLTLVGTPSSIWSFPLFYASRQGVSILPRACTEAWYLACSTIAAPIYGTGLMSPEAEYLHTFYDDSGNGWQKEKCHTSRNAFIWVCCSSEYWYIGCTTVPCSGAVKTALTMVRNEELGERKWTDNRGCLVPHVDLHS